MTWKRAHDSDSLSGTEILRRRRSTRFGLGTGRRVKVTVREGKKQERELKIKPVALKRELHAERRHLDNPTGTLVRRDRLCATLAGELHV